MCPGFPYSKLQERVLHLEVLDYDRFSRNDAIGETNLPLQEVDLTQETMYWRPLVPSKKGPVSKQKNKRSVTENKVLDLMWWLAGLAFLES